LDPTQQKLNNITHNGAALQEFERELDIQVSDAIYKDLKITQNVSSSKLF